MKEQLRLFWELDNRKEAEQFLTVWCRDAMNSGIKALKRVGKTLVAYRTGLLNFFDHRITSGAVEGLIRSTKSRPSEGRPTASGIRSISSCDSITFIRSNIL
jgi:transposase